MRLPPFMAEDNADGLLFEAFIRNFTCLKARTRHQIVGTACPVQPQTTLYALLTKAAKSFKSVENSLKHTEFKVVKHDLGTRYAALNAR